MARDGPLVKFSEDELIEELARRRNARASDEPRKWCHDCEHCIPLGKDDMQCSEGHKMTFHVPSDYDEINDGEWGYYRRVCADRKEKERSDEQTSD